MGKSENFEKRDLNGHIQPNPKGGVEAQKKKKGTPKPIPSHPKKNGWDKGKNGKGPVAVRTRPH